MHDYTGVVLKHQNNEGVVFSYTVDTDGYIAVPITAEPIRNYRHEGFAVYATYVCECGNEYANWQDVEDHLTVFAPTAVWEP
jgi:hypothetical protein